MIGLAREPLPGVGPGGGAEGTPYPSFEVASHAKWRLDWDEKTRRLVLDRLRNVPSYRFFSAEEATLLEALCARALPQDDRLPGQRVLIAPWIDERLDCGEGDGYRYEDMPDDGETYRQGLAGFEETAQIFFHAAYVNLTSAQQDEVFHCVAAGSPPGRIWERLSAVRFFQKLMSDVISNYYAHPAAWAEIGFSGPASPRGHIRLGLRKRDPWEAEETHSRSSVDIVRGARKRGGQPAGGETH